MGCTKQQIHLRRPGTDAAKGDEPGPCLLHTRGPLPLLLHQAPLLGFELRARRLELPVGGFLGFVHEALRVSPGQPWPACAIQGTGTLVGARSGGVAGGRLGFAVLVGARRHHELGMHLTLAFHGFAPGPAAATAATASCDAASGRVLQDVPRARLMLTAALGYAFRF